MRELRKTETTLNRENDDLKFKNEDKAGKFKGLQEQLELTQKRLEDEAKMVSYLQKQINDKPLRSVPYSTSLYQPSVPYSGLNRELPSQLSANSNISTSRVVHSTLNPKE
jgi:hypothetical protein